MNSLPTNSTSSSGSNFPHPARGFCQSFALHPATALLTLAVDSMVFSTELAGFGLLLSIPVGLAVWRLSYRAQLDLYGDDEESAAVKAKILGFLTAIPSPLAAILYVPAGIIGFFNRKD